MAAATGDEIAAKFCRFVDKNPFFLRPIQNFYDKHCHKFAGEVGDEHSHEFVALHHDFVQIVSKSLSLFVSRTKGCDEKVLLEALERGVKSCAEGKTTKASAEQEALYEKTVSVLVATTDYSSFVGLMRRRRMKAEAFAFDDLRSGLLTKTK